MFFHPISKDIRKFISKTTIKNYISYMAIVKKPVAAAPAAAKPAPAPQGAVAKPVSAAPAANADVNAFGILAQKATEA
jgi:hypothetical protein